MDISHVAENIWIASRFYPFDDDLPPNAVVIDCSVLRDDDSDQQEHIEAIAEAVGHAAWRLDLPVVLVCDAGRNRSAVVAAVVLAWRGYEDPISVVREARAWALRRTGGALTNERFVELLG